ncbi:hypothetical protein ACM16X_02505 [Haloarcula japonica]|uniref:hypothetical protein n=1 Tax=Haloarcula japonica TaxID=29282 RepID=UPI0039F71928
MGQDPEYAAEIFEDLQLTFSSGLADIFQVLDSADRLDAFFLLSEGHSAKRISDERGFSRSTLQNYVNDFKRAGFYSKDGNSYVLTRKGEAVRYILSALDEAFPVLLAGSIVDEVEASGLEVDEEDVEKFQSQLLMQSNSYNRKYPWDEVANEAFWEAIGRREMIAALENAKTAPEVFNPTKTFNIYLERDELEEYAKDPEKGRSSREDRLWMLYEGGEVREVEEVVEEEGYWKSELIDEVDFSEYGRDWSQFFNDFSEEEIKDIFGEGGGEQLIEQYELSPETGEL